MTTQNDLPYWEGRGPSVFIGYSDSEGQMPAYSEGIFAPEIREIQGDYCPCGCKLFWSSSREHFDLEKAYCSRCMKDIYRHKD